MENTLYIVASHYVNGPSLWIRSTQEEATKKAKELLLVELNSIKDENIVREMRDALDKDQIKEANEIWWPISDR